MRKMGGGGGGGGADVGAEEKDPERGVRRIIGGRVRGNAGRGVAGRTRQSVRGG